MIITSVINPVWVDENRTIINCIITNDRFGDEQLSFTASLNDVEAYGQTLFADLVAGKYGPIAEFVPEPGPTITRRKRSKS